MVNKFVSCLVLCLMVYAESENKKWVWGDNNRDKGRSFGPSEEASSRYEIYENDDVNSYPGVGNTFGLGPGLGQYPGQIPSKPLPDNIYNGNNQLYGEGHGQYYPNDRPSAGPWQQGGPFKEFDRCKCTERFNCNSPGISYGHCDVGKRYCCYSTTKKGQAGGPPPSRPVHSIENGILVGPGGPVGGGSFQGSIGGFGRPIRPGVGGPIRPGSGGFGPIRPGAGIVGGSYRPGGGYGGLIRPGLDDGPNVYSPENGILVGPGGPSNRPNFGITGGFRSANNKKD